MKFFGDHYLYVTVFMTGAAILVLEILGTRILAPFYGTTIFVWSSLIAVTLGFLALGYWIGGELADQAKKKNNKYGRWLRCNPKELLALTIFFGALGFLLIPLLDTYVLTITDSLGIRFGPLVASLILFSIPVFALGMVTPIVIKQTIENLTSVGLDSGKIFAWGTLGSLTGALLAGFILLPLFSLTTIFTVTAFLLLLTATMGYFFSLDNKKISLQSVIIFGVIAIFLFTAQLFLNNNDNPKILFHEAGFYGSVDVIEVDGLRCLMVSGQGQTCARNNGDSALPYIDSIVAIVESHEMKMENILVVGLGGGALREPLSLLAESVDFVEIDPAILKAAREFFNYTDSSHQITTYIDDGRRHIRTTDKKYDVIILDAFIGSLPVSHLYTQEAFGEMRNILSPEGVIIANTIGYTYGAKAALQTSVYRTMKAEFPYVSVFSTEDTTKDRGAFGNVFFVTGKALYFASPAQEENYFQVAYNDKEIDGAYTLTDEHNSLEVLGAPIVDVTHRNHKNFLIKP